MAFKFPSREFFQELANRMKADPVAFEKLGVCDTTMGVRVLGETPRLFGLEFEVYECVEVSEREPTDQEGLDFILEAPLPVWQEMLAAICKHEGADAAHTLNTLSHLNDQVVVQYDDPEGHDKFYRFMATIQAYFDLAQDLEIELT